MEKKFANETDRDPDEAVREMYSSALVGLFRARIRDGRFLIVNDYIADFFQFDAPEEMLAGGCTLADFLASGELNALVHDLSAGGEIVDREIVFTPRDGMKIRAVLSAKPSMEEGCFDGLIRCFTGEEEPGSRPPESEEHYRRLYEESRKAQEAYQSLLHSSPDAIVLYDIHGNLTYVNPAFTETFGWTLDEMEMQGAPFFTEFGSVENMQAIARLIETGDPCYALESRRCTKDGRWLDIGMSASRYNDHKGRPAGLLIILRNITEKKRLEIQLRRSQRVEALGTLAGGIAHDFNNILTPIMIHSEMALNKAAPLPDLVPHLEKVLKAGHRAVNLISQILAFSRREEQKRKPIQIESIVKETLKLLRATLPTTIEIRQHIASNPGTVMGDAGQIHQVLMNLCTNAKHAMRREGGVLDVRLEGIPVDSEKSRRLSGLPAGAYIELTVRDTGCGIENNLMEKIFEPYFTTKKKGEGTGLGLAMVQGIVTALGGAITVESKPRSGTAFHVFFPLTMGHFKEKQTNRKKVTGGGERILFVDDEKATVDSIGEFLTYLGYDVIGSTSSVAALRMFQADPDGFDLVITDQTMPRMTGGELVKKVLDIRPDARIILCTGYSDVMDEHDALILGVRRFLMKPFVTDDLSAVIRDVLDEKKAPRVIGAPIIDIGS